MLGALAFNLDVMAAASAWRDRMTVRDKSTSKETKAEAKARRKAGLEAFARTLDPDDRAKGRAMKTAGLDG